MAKSNLNSMQLKKNDLLPNTDDLHVHLLAGIFKVKTQSYKLFLFQAILDSVSEGKTLIKYEELIHRTIAEAWYMVMEYHLNLGPADALEILIKRRGEIKMTLLEAMNTRHSVRKYIDRELPEDIIEKLNERIVENNEKYNLNMRMVINNDDAINSVFKLFLKNVKNYIVLAGEDLENIHEKLGYSGTDVMLYAQTLGLNSCWIGGTYNKNKVVKSADFRNNEIITGIIAIGYGKTQGVQHKSKKAKDISSYNGDAPQWFKDGVEAVLLAPTALNRQGFTIKGDGNTVFIGAENGNFSGTDIGIGKYHFELAAGKDNFNWE